MHETEVHRYIQTRHKTDNWHLRIDISLDSIFLGWQSKTGECLLQWEHGTSDSAHWLSWPIYGCTVMMIRLRHLPSAPRKPVLLT